jgi:hypothetical protein
LQIAPEKIPVSGTAAISVKIKNTGKVEVTEVVLQKISGKLVACR